MMGTSHAISGGAAWIAVTSLGLYETTPTAALLGTVVCAGAALLPDADHHNATIAHSVPVAGKVVAGAVGGLTGGHRKGMHSLIAVVVVIFAMFWLGQLTWQPDGWDVTIHAGAAIATACCIAFATKVLKITKSWLIAWIIGIAVGFGIGLLSPAQAAWLPWCIGTGYLVHLLGDAITVGGVPFLWPVMIKPPKALRKTPLISNIWLSHGAVALPILGKTGSWREWALSVALAAYTVWGVSMTSIALLQT